MANVDRPSGTEYYTGFDGGGTYTRVLVEDNQGREVFRARGDGGNVFKLGVKQVIFNISQLVKQILEQVPDYQQYAVRACLGLAGVSEGKPPRELVAALSSVGIGAEQILHNDAYLSWYSIARGDPAVALISGTGSVAFGVDESGEVVTSGGFGYLYADEGSGFDIGANGIRAAIRAYENRGPFTELLGVLLTQYNLKHVSELPGCLTDPRTVAHFAPSVHAQAKQGDAEAIRIIEDAARELASLLESVKVQGNFVSGGRVKTALFGGCLIAMELLRTQVGERIIDLGMEVCAPRISPEQAAVEIARSA